MEPSPHNLLQQASHIKLSFAFHHIFYFHVLQNHEVTLVHHVDWMSRYVTTRMLTVIAGSVCVDRDSLRKMAFAVSYVHLLLS